MTHTDYTKNILNIKDPNIIFDENCLEERTINKITYKIFHTKLTYNPSCCPICGCLYESNPDTIIKYGFKKNCKIKLDRLSNYSTILLLDKQRFLCKHCHSTFTASTDLVDFHKQISNNTKTSITLDLMHKGTVSKMAFIIVDQNRKTIFDINNSRFSKDISSYFLRYQKKDRDNVKFITMDLYKPYYKLMSSLFRNALLIPDRFHIIIQVRNALDLTRIKLCTKSNPNYRKLKKYWKLILKDKRDLNKTDKHYQKCFKKDMTQDEIVTYLINTNNELYETYQVYQSILYSINTRNKNIFLSIINGKNKYISKYMKKAIRTFKSLKNI